jgi:hypothetical protein
VFDEVSVELEFGQLAGCGFQFEVGRGREGQQRAESAAARAVAGNHLTQLELDLIAHLAALAAAGVRLRHV